MAPELFPGAPAADAQRDIGRQCVVGWKHTFLGRALTPLIRLLPPRRALGRLERNFRSTDNFTRIDLSDVGPTAVELHLHDVLGVPHFYEGFLDEGADLSSAKNPHCRLVAIDGDRARFRREWAP